MQKRAIIYIVCILGFLDISIAHSRSKRANGPSDGQLQSPEDIERRQVIHKQIGTLHGSLSELLVRQCWNRGVPPPYPNYYAVLKNVTECLKSEADFRLDLGQLWLELNLPGPKNTWKEMVEKTCHSRDEIEACSRPAANSFNVCYDPGERKAMANVHDMSRAVIDYICRDNGAAFLAFIVDSQCLLESEPAIVNCVSKLGSLPQNSRTGLRKTDNDFLVFMKFEKDQCSQMQQIRVCTRTGLEKCNNPGSVNFMDDLIQAGMVPPCSGTSGSWMISRTFVFVVTVVLVHPTFT